MDKNSPEITSGPTNEQRPRARSILFKISAWTAAVVVALALIAAITTTMLLNSGRFHSYVLNRARAEASDALGVRVQLQNFAISLSALSLDLYGITVDGASPYSNPPLLQVDHVKIGVRIVSILHGKWYLDNFQIDRPIARVFMDAHGVSNLPTIKSSENSNSNTNLFDLAIRRAVLDNGEVYFNDKQTPLSADLHDVDFRASFNTSLQKYSGRLAYSDGHLISGSLKPIPHDLEAEFDATRTTFQLTRAKLTSGSSQILLNGTLNNYAAPNVEASYDVQVDGGQVRNILGNSFVPTGSVRAVGFARYVTVAGRSLLDSLEVNGDIQSKQLKLDTPKLHSQISNLVGHYSLRNGDVTLQDLRASTLGGLIEATGVMSDVGGKSHTKVNANLNRISLPELKRLLGRNTALNGLALAGTLNAKATATWGQTLQDLTAQVDSTIQGNVAKAQTNAIKNASLSQDTVPIESALHGRYSASDKQLTLTNSFLRTPQTNLTLNGKISERSSLAIRLQVDDLRELESIADIFRTPAEGETLQPLGLAGTASFQGAVTGTVTSPHLTGQLTASNFHVNGTEWKVFRTGLDVSPSQLALQHAELDPAPRGHITFNVSTGLTNWAFTKTSQIQVDLNSSQLDIAALTQLAGQQIPVSGTLAANLKLHGTELNPVGNGNLTIAGIVAYKQPIQSVKLTFSGTGDEAHGDLNVDLPAGHIQSNFTVEPKQRTYTAKLNASGIRLEKLDGLKANNVNATGELSLNASGQGSFDNPQLNAILQIPRLSIQNQIISALNLRLDVADHFANANLTTSAVNTNIQAKARISLSGDYLTDATLDTQAIPLQPLIAIYAPEQADSVTGQTEVHATLHGPLKNKNLLEAHVTVPVLQLAYGKSVQLAAASPIRVDYKDGVAELRHSSIRGTDTDLQFQGSIPTTGAGQLSLMLLGTVNLQLAQLFDPDIRTGGELKFNINSSGPANGANFSGQIQIVDAAFASSDLPVGLQHGNGVLTLTKDRLSITSFQGTVGGGTLTAQGGVALQPKLQFDVGLTAKDLRVLYPQGVRENVNANLRLAGTTDNAVLGGSVNLSDLSFTSAFDLSSFISQFSGGVSAPPTPGFSQDLRLNLAVRSSSNVSLVSRTLSIGGSANLQVRGTAANPVILGRVNLDNGDIILNGDRFLLNGGTIEFVNPSETEPVVNVSLKTTIQQYDVYLRFNGPIAQLRTNYSSDPALPSADIINLLAFGQTTEANSANPSTTANQAAESLVASQVSSQVTSRVSKIAGISQLSINPVLASGTSQGPAGANVTIQQRVTGNLFITFSSNVASTQSQTIQGQYQLSPRVAVSATRDQNGGFAFDTLIKKSW